MFVDWCEDSQQFVVDFQVDGYSWNYHWPVRKIPASVASLLRIPRDASFSVRAKDVADQVAVRAIRRLRLAEHAPQIERLSELQSCGAYWLAVGSGLLTDEMGSGKTVQACAAMELFKPERVLVVCPAVTVRHWVEHLSEWCPYVMPVPVVGSRSARNKIIRDVLPNTALVMSWDVLRTHIKLSKYGSLKMSEEDKQPGMLNAVSEFDVLIVDEAHRAHNPRAKRTRALWSVKAKKVWALTGTPISNTAADLWSLLRLLSPKDWPSRVRFIDAFCDKEVNHWSGSVEAKGFASQSKQLLDELMSHQMLHRTMAEAIGRDIVKGRSVRYCQLPDDHRESYNEFKKYLVTSFEGGGEVSASNALVWVGMAHRMAAAPLDAAPEDVSAATVMLEPSPKLDTLEEVLDEVGGLPVVVMSASRQLAEMAVERLGDRCVLYAGGTGDAGLKAWVAGEFQVIVCTTGAAAEGVDLSRAKHLVMLQRPLSMVQTVQAEDRVRRWSQRSDAVEIIDVVTEDTIDERLRALVQSKKEVLADLLTGKEYLRLL